jgi:hypothetical protein
MVNISAQVCYFWILAVSWVRGSKNVYFMLDSIYIPKEAFTGLHTESEWADAYAYYHGLKDIKTGAFRDNIKKMPGSFKMKGIKLLHK